MPNFILLRCGLKRFLPKLAWNTDPLNVSCLSSCQDYRHELPVPGSIDFLKGSLNRWNMRELESTREAATAVYSLDEAGDGRGGRWGPRDWLVGQVGEGKK
jgi:hypothetical protein